MIDAAIDDRIRDAVARGAVMAMSLSGGKDSTAAAFAVNAILDAASAWDGPIPGNGTVRMVIAGAPPPTRTIERIETELGWEFIQIYGLTETTPLLTMNRKRAEFDALSPGERAAKLGRAGAPAIGVEVRISPDGEVLARGNHIMAGYWEQPDATAERLLSFMLVIKYTYEMALFVAGGRFRCRLAIVVLRGADIVAFRTQHALSTQS